MKFKGKPTHLCHRCVGKSIVVVGSVALDTVKTNYGSVDDALGGSATYFTIAARLFSPVNVVGVIGRDFPKNYLKILQSPKTNLQGLIQMEGKTFRWKGSYENPNEALTHDTQLNVFANFNPQLPDGYRSSKYLFLANIHPELQEKVLNQLNGNCLIACDTMNHWILTHKDLLLKLYSKVKIVFLNENEAKLLSGEKHLIDAAQVISQKGPDWVIIKKGENGVLAYNGKAYTVLPAYPVSRVIDTTGAGDSFAGGFMGYIAQKGNLKPSTVMKALVYGTVIASFTVQDFGTRSIGKVTHQMIRKRYHEFLKMMGR